MVVCAKINMPELSHFCRSSDIDLVVSTLCIFTWTKQKSSTIVYYSVYSALSSDFVQDFAG